MLFNTDWLIKKKKDKSVLMEMSSYMVLEKNICCTAEYFIVYTQNFRT